MEIVGYDTETWSGNQISKGLDHYFSDPKFEIICAGWADSTGYSTSEFMAMNPKGSGSIFCAHNAPFDRRAVAKFYPDKPDVMWFDTMVGVRAILGGSLGRNSYVSLDRSAKLLLPEEYHKDSKGAELMSYFSFPSPMNNFGATPWRKMIDRHPNEWYLYKQYCGQDARVAYELAALTKEYLGDEAFERLVYEAELTYRMNRMGWPVDEHLLQVMADRAQENTDNSITNLIEEYNPGFSVVKKNGEEKFTALNLNSGVQLKKWLAMRDIDIDDTQADTITETIEFVEDNLDVRPDWTEVLAVLQAKVDRGGATLKKLAPIAKGLSSDGRLRDMYNHIAASSTHRTTGSGVQMQNLKRLPDEVEDLTEEGIATMDNSTLAVNIRQLFQAKDGGEIVVADLKSIEGLLVGWVFGVEWMVDAVRDGKDMYTMNAVTRFKVPYGTVLPQQRRRSKTGVLAGNYGGGVKAYMKQSTMSEDEAKAEVKAYRDTVPNLVQSWWDLNDLLIEAVEDGDAYLRLHNGYSVEAHTMLDTSMAESSGGATLEITMQFKGKKIFSRLWHGVQIELDASNRKEVTYAVAEERKTVPVGWKRETTTGERFKLYGGKLTGTLIQSLARELYFYQLNALSRYASGSTFGIIGQLHDEIVCEWNSRSVWPLKRVERTIENVMTQVPWYLEGCPVRVKVSHAPRYIK